MSRFKYFEDFNLQIEEFLEKSHLSEMYLFSFRTSTFDTLDVSEQNYILKNTPIKIHKSEIIVKFRAAASFYYKRSKKIVLVTKVTRKFVLFGMPIFPAVSLGDLKRIEKENQKDDWAWYYNENHSLLLIVKGTLSDEEFQWMVSLHTDYLDNSLNSRNVTYKRSNIFVDGYKNYCETVLQTQAFLPSLEDTLQNIIEYIYHEHCVIESDEISLIVLLKFATVLENSKKQNANGSLNSSLSPCGCNENKLKGSLELLLSDFIRYDIMINILKTTGLSVFNDNTYADIATEICKYYFSTREDNEHKVYIRPDTIKEWAVPIGFKLNEEKGYVLVIPISKHNHRESFRYSLVLMSPKRIKNHLLDNINAIFSEYFLIYLESQKNDLLRTLQSKLFDRQLVVDSLSIEEKFEKLAQEAFDKMVQITSAYSATLRWYRPSENILEKKVDSFNPEIKDVDDTEEVREIDVKIKAKSSLNCRALLLRKGDKYASYISDIRKPDKKFRTITRRAQTVSELSMPLYYQGAALGVINFESPLLNAFDDECVSSNSIDGVKYYIASNSDKYVELRPDSFFYKVKQALQNYYSMLAEGNDSRHLSRLIERETNLHELKNLVDTCIVAEQSLDPFKIEIQQLLKTTRSMSVAGDNKLKAKEIFYEIRTERIDTYFNGVGNMGVIKPEQFNDSNYLRIHLPIKIEECADNPLMILNKIQPYLRIIYRNLLTNFIVHGDKEKDILKLSYIKKINTIVITQIYNKLNLSGRRWFYSPIDEDEEVKSGLFIVGTSVRQLGGHVFTSYDNYDRLRRFDIHINLNTAENIWRGQQ